MALMNCPNCRMFVSETAKQCPSCGFSFDIMEMITCPVCRHTISIKAMICPNCGHPLQQENTIRITFPPSGAMQIFNKFCYIYENTGYLIRKCQLGETVEIKSNTDIDVVIKLDAAFGKLNTILEPGGWYQVKLSNWIGKINIIKSSLNLE